MNDLAYFNAKFNHLNKVVDQIITVCDRATGLEYYLQLKTLKPNYKL